MVSHFGKTVAEGDAFQTGTTVKGIVADSHQSFAYHKGTDVSFISEYAVVGIGIDGTIRLRYHPFLYGTVSGCQRVCH